MRRRRMLMTLLGAMSSMGGSCRSNCRQNLSHDTPKQTPANSVTINPTKYSVVDVKGGSLIASK